MELKTMLLPEKTVEFDFPGCKGFKVKLAFLSKESNQKIYKKCQRTEINPRTRQPIEKFDDELFLSIYVKSIIKGWKGLKYKYLKELVLVDIPEGEEDKLLEFSENNALELMKSSVTFDNWVSEVISDLGNFTRNNLNENLE